MKKIMTILMVLLFCVGGLAYGYQRISIPLPEIGEPIGILTEATGWTLSPTGQWNSRKNRIPAYISSDILLDHKDYGLGIDNFQSITISNITIEEKEYYLLIKKRRGGYYEYASIRKGWRSRDHTLYYVFEKKELEKIKDVNIKAEPQLIEIDLLFMGGGPSAIINIPAGIQKKILEEKECNTKLLINILPLPDQNTVRFTMIYLDDFTYLEYYGGIAGGRRVLPDDGAEILATEDTFRNYYYETDIDKFKALFPIGG